MAEPISGGLRHPGLHDANSVPRRKTDSQDDYFLRTMTTNRGLAWVVGLVGGLCHMLNLAMLHERRGIETGSQFARDMSPATLPSQRHNRVEKVVRSGLRTVLSPSLSGQECRPRICPGPLAALRIIAMCRCANARWRIAGVGTAGCVGHRMCPAMPKRIEVWIPDCDAIQAERIGLKMPLAARL